MNANILEKIAASTRLRVEAEKRKVPYGRLREAAFHARVPCDFRAAFLSDEVHIIAEIKLASPSRGDIAPLADPREIAKQYLDGGARAVSVLTEPEFFKGSALYLQQVRAACPESRLLMKDFVVDEYQLAKARVDGADCILLIVALLGGKRTPLFMKKARELGLSCLVEVHDEEELKIALDSGAALIGVNNRDLTTLRIDPDTSIRLASLVTDEVVLISESGFSSGREIVKLRNSGYRGFLVGTALMKEACPGEALRRLLAGARA
jgi:indole-3-glycerol phosphate synthase